MGTVLGSAGAAREGEADHHVWLVIKAVMRAAQKGDIQS